MSRLKQTADDARVNLATEKFQAKDRLKRFLREFAILTPMVKSCLKEFGDETLGTFLGFPLYKCYTTCDKTLEGSHCWSVTKRINIQTAGVCVYLSERMENNKPAGTYYFKIGAETKDTSEQELKNLLRDCVEGVLRDIERYKAQKSSD
jgi:hypothetical protein